MLSLSVNLKLPAHGTPSSPEKHASARGACFSGDDGGGLQRSPPPRRNEAGDAPRPHRKEYRQYRLAESLLAHRSHDVRSNTSRDCLLGEDSLYSFVLRFFYQLSDNADCTLFCSVCEPSEAFLCRRTTKSLPIVTALSRLRFWSATQTSRPQGHARADTRT